MSMVLGLSLTAEDVVWVLVDEADGTVADHDAIEFHSDTEIAGAAARGAHKIATAGGHDVNRIRLTWSEDVTREGLRLSDRLTGLGFDNVEEVPLASAGAVLVDPGTEPDLALALGAALATVGARDGVTAPLAARTAARPARRALTRGRIAMATLGAAAAIAATGLLLSSGSLSHVEPTAAAANRPTPADPGWVAVIAEPSESADSAARAVRRVVEAPRETPVTVAQAAPAWQPEPAPPAPAEPIAQTEPAVQTEPAAQADPVTSAPEAVAVAQPVPVTEVPHLPAGEPHLAAPEPLSAATAQPHLPAGELPAVGPAAVDPGLPSAPEMTDPANLFTALP